MTHFNSPATVLFVDIKSHSKRHWTIRASFRAAIIIWTLLVCFAGGTPAVARGGHGMGGFGMHGEREVRGGGLLTPVYVLIVVSKITDADVFKVAMSDLTAPNAAFAGRLTVDAEKPAAWEGTTTEHIAMLQFDNADQAQAWKNSDAFKSFDADLHRSSESTIQLVQGLPTLAPREVGARRRGRGFDQKAFEANVKDYDQTLTKLHGICKGC
jgi:uncharacterized protein (DUF1330 family)